jgi:hypothetical protein
VIAALAAGLAFLSPAPARMLVTADEWTLVSSRQRIAAGKLEIQLYNRGQDGHDLAARRIGAARTFRVSETKPGQLGEATWRLKRGRYRLWCDLPGHRAAGMRASLRVR